MKWEKLYKSAFMPWIVVCGGALLMTYIARGPGGRYVVADKKDNKILYYPIAMPNDIHVMTFDADTTGTGLYHYLNVGDTITGAARRFDEPVVKSTAMGIRPPLQYYIIETVNGHELRDLPVFARRDSILRDMHGRQK